LANRLVQDYNVYMLASHGLGEQQFFSLDPRVIVKVFSAHPARLRTMIPQLYGPVKRYLREQGIDVVLAVGNTQAYNLLPVAATLRSTRFVYCDHGSLEVQWDQSENRLLNRLSVRFFDAIVTLTQRNRQNYLDRLHANPAKVQVIHNWIDTELIARPVVYDLQAKRLLWAGRLDSEKGVDLLLDIAEELLPAFPAWEWHVFGAGELEDMFREQVRLRGLEGQLILKGYTQNLAEHYARYAVVTLTSYREGLPLVLLEGKAFGLPLISFDVVTGPREIIRDGTDGFLIDCYDVVAYARRLAQLMDSAELRARMSAASQETLGLFEQETIYGQWKSLIEQITA
jgi:glycosyltransferase involved in cell wall biosynthesis